MASNSRGGPNEPKVVNETLIEIIRRGPVRVTMNDGSTHVIQSLEWCLVTPIYAHVLYRSEDGKLKSHFLSLVCMARVEELEPTEIG